MKFPFYDSSNRTTSLSAAAIQMCWGNKTNYEILRENALQKQSARHSSSHLVYMAQSTLQALHYFHSKNILYTFDVDFTWHFTHLPYTTHFNCRWLLKLHQCSVNSSLSYIRKGKCRPATTPTPTPTPPSRSGYPPWILKRGGLESSGRRLNS